MLSIRIMLVLHAYIEGPRSQVRAADVAPRTRAGLLSGYPQVLSPNLSLFQHVSV